MVNRLIKIIVPKLQKRFEFFPRQTQFLSDNFAEQAWPDFFARMHRNSGGPAIRMLEYSVATSLMVEDKTEFSGNSSEFFAG